MLKIACLEIYVTDMAKAVAFYNLVGFEVRGRAGYPHVVSLKHDGDFRLLLLKVETLATAPYPHGSRIQFVIETTDLAETISTLRERGVDWLHNEPQKFPRGFFAAIRDPFGNVFEFVEFKPLASKTQESALPGEA